MITIPLIDPVIDYPPMDPGLHPSDMSVLSPPHRCSILLVDAQMFGVLHVSGISAKFSNLAFQ